MIITDTAIDAALDAFWPGMPWRTRDDDFVQRVRDDMRKAILAATLATRETLQ